MNHLERIVCCVILYFGMSFPCSRLLHQDYWSGETGALAIILSVFLAMLIEINCTLLKLIKKEGAKRSNIILEDKGNICTSKLKRPEKISNKDVNLKIVSMGRI